MRTPEMPPQPRLGLINARTSRSLSQHDVAERIDTTHVNVSRWERGITKPSPYFRRKLCTFFQMTEDDLDLLPIRTATEKKAPGADSVSTTPIPSEPMPPQPIYDPAIPLPSAVKLIGRERELTEIKKQLCQGDKAALTALNGLPGVGKTALSITLAHDPEIRTYFKDGVLWAGLGPNPNMPGLLSRWGSLLGISTTQMEKLNSGKAWAEAIRSAIGTRSLLLVIDDAWKLEEAQTFHVGGPNCAHLVTTRFPSIAAAIAIRGATQIQELDTEKSIELLNQLAPQVVQRETKKTNALVLAVGGLPLALTLMGNYLRKQAYSGPTRRITAALEKLNNAATRLTINEPHPPADSHTSLPVETALSLQSIIAVTEQFLNEATRHTLYTFSVFPPKPNTFSEEAALAIAACSYDELDALSDAGLLENSGGDRYHIHQTISDYAQLQLKNEDLLTARIRLIDYVADYVETHKKEYEALEQESSTILAALETANTLDRTDELIRTVLAFTPFLMLRGFYALAQQHLEQAHGKAQSLQSTTEITAIKLHLGEVSLKQGNYPQAETYFQDGLTLARETNDNEKICALLTGLGEVKQKSGDNIQAETYFQDGLTLARQINDQLQIIILLTNLGGIIARQGNFSQAEQLLQEGLELAQQLEDKERICGLYKLLGFVAAIRGDYAQSEIYFQEGLTIARETENREQVCWLLSNLGAASAKRGYYNQAAIYFQEGLPLARQIGLKDLVCMFLINLGNVAFENSQYTEAEHYFQEGLHQARQIGHSEWISTLLTDLGRIKRLQKDYKQADQYLKESLTLVKQTHNIQPIGRVLIEYGTLYLEQKNIEDARSKFQEILDTIPYEHKDLLALAQYGLAQTYEYQKNTKKAKELGKQSLDILASIEHYKYNEVKRWLDSIAD